MFNEFGGIKDIIYVHDEDRYYLQGADKVEDYVIIEVFAGP